MYSPCDAIFQSILQAYTETRVKSTAQQFRSKILKTNFSCFTTQIMGIHRTYSSTHPCSGQSTRLEGKNIIIVNWLEGRTIKYTNFPAKYMNSRSKLHWNIHVVLCQVSVTWNKHRGIGIPELHERHSAFNTSSKWISLIFYFYDIFLVFFPLMWCLQVYWH